MKIQLCSLIPVILFSMSSVAPTPPMLILIGSSSSIAKITNFLNSSFPLPSIQPLGQQTFCTSLSTDFQGTTFRPIVQGSPPQKASACSGCAVKYRFWRRAVFIFK